MGFRLKVDPTIEIVRTKNMLLMSGNDIDGAITKLLASGVSQAVIDTATAQLVAENKIELVEEGPK